MVLEVLAALDGPAARDWRVLQDWRAACPKLRALWDESTLVSEWAGVDIGKDGRVVKLDLTSRDLSCVVPAELGSLTSLTAGAYTRPLRIQA